MVEKISPEAEAALERIFSDAKEGTDTPLYNGRVSDEIEDDIALIREELDIEL